MRRIMFPLAGLLLLIGTAGCGSDEPGGDVQPSDTGAPSAQATDTGSGGCTDASATDLSGDDPFAITIRDSTWDPDCVKASGAAAITIENKDSVDHTFTIPDTQIDAPLPGNETFNGEAAGLDPGTYEFICTIHPTITGTIIVV